MLCPSGIGAQRVQLELKYDDVGEKETLKDAFGQSTCTKGDAGQMGMAGDVSSLNTTWVAL